MPVVAVRLLMAPFATAIFAKVEALLSLDLKAAHRSRFSESISEDIKKASNLHPHRMSVAARSRALRLNPPVDLAAMTWHDQDKFDPGREIFILEHRATVSSLKRRCLAAASQDAVLDVLEAEIDVVWILRDEDDELTRLKYVSKRPSTAYDEAKIEIWEGD